MKKDKSGFIQGVIQYKNIVYLLVAVFVVLGVFSILRINKDEFPTFEIKEGLVVGVYPGASAEQVEQQLTKPLEDVLFTVPEVLRSSNSYTQNGICYIYVNLDCSPQKRNEVWTKIKMKLSAAKMTLPPGVLAVQVIDEFGSVSSMLVAMESSDKSYSQLEKYAQELSSRLYELEKLASVKILGKQQEEVAVTVDQQLLSKYILNNNSLVLELQSGSLQLLSGNFKTDYINAPLLVEENISTQRQVEESVVWSSPDGEVLRVKDIATVEKRYKTPDSYVAFNGNSALVLSIEMKPKNNIVTFGDEVRGVLEKYKEELPESVTLTTISDQPEVVRVSVWSFLRDLLVSMVVVILVMLLLFPMRSALIASSAVPVCVAVAVAIMYLVGMELNTVTLAALIVVLGMIVDDAVITMDGYMDKMSRGYRRVEAAAVSMKELFVPMLLATTSISLMFFPVLGIISGYLGDFVKMFPWVILIALTASLIYAVLVVPSLEVHYIRQFEQSRKNLLTRFQGHLFNSIQGGYERLQKVCFRHPAMTVGVGVAVVLLGVFLFTRINIQMMPMAVRDYFAVEISLEPDCTLGQTKEVADSLGKILSSDPRIVSVTSFIGTGAPRFHATYSPKIPSATFAQMIVNTVDSKETAQILKDYEKKYEYYFPSAQVRFKQLDYQGTPAPIQISFKGGESSQMQPFADSLKKYMVESMGGTLKWVHTDNDKSKSVISLSMDDYESSRLGVNRAMLSFFVSELTAGGNLATLWEDGKKVPVNLYSSTITPQMSYADMMDQMIPATLPSVMVPLRQVAQISPEWHPEVISHIGGKDVVSVYADLNSGSSQPDAMREIKDFLASQIVPNLPEGVEIDFGGLSSVNGKVIPEILLSLICAVLVLFGFLLYHFKNISLSVLTIVLSLLSLFGASFGLWIFNLDFSITAVLGVVSLIGIVVRNGILMFEYAQTLRLEQGFDPRKAAMEAGKRRARPIFLTSCTTALGVLPMVISADDLWMPMGVVICFGTMLSIILIVEIMPVCYWLMYRNEK
ncbi:MAG: efflux RND transporter permease subunit [Bacteroidales bacterium]|nr:efflux RND transporter permease subunit [Bacteroidales bacterium]